MFVVDEKFMESCEDLCCELEADENQFASDFRRLMDAIWLADEFLRLYENGELTKDHPLRDGEHRAAVLADFEICAEQCDIMDEWGADEMTQLCGTLGFAYQAIEKLFPTKKPEPIVFPANASIKVEEIRERRYVEEVTPEPPTPKEPLKVVITPESKFARYTVYGYEGEDGEGDEESYANCIGCDESIDVLVIDGVIALIGDYYHDKIEYQIAGYLQALEDLWGYKPKMECYDVVDGIYGSNWGDPDTSELYPPDIKPLYIKEC